MKFKVRKNDMIFMKNPNKLIFFSISNNCYLNRVRKERTVHVRAIIFAYLRRLRRFRIFRKSCRNHDFFPGITYFLGMGKILFYSKLKQNRCKELQTHITHKFSAT